MMRIAFFLPDLRGGGAEKTVINLLKEWVGQDLSMELVLVRAAGVYPYWIARESMKNCTDH